jgi:hypothetical protein
VNRGDSASVVVDATTVVVVDEDVVDEDVVDEDVVDEDVVDEESIVVELGSVEVVVEPDSSRAWARGEIDNIVQTTASTTPAAIEARFVSREIIGTASVYRRCTTGFLWAWNS